MDISQYPEYRSHKIVRAAEIQEVNGTTVTLVQGNNQLRFETLPPEMFIRYTPKKGDYLVIYEDGYLSFSPKAVFDAGYTPVPGVPSEAKIEQIAKLTHAVNKAWCEFNGDHSQRSWDLAPEWQKESARSGVRFHLNNPGAGDSASHDEWMRHKLADGWTYGEVKDETKKTHPCLVPFEALPPEQQFKDRLFRTIVHTAV